MNVRKAQIWSMYQRGKSFAEIGVELGIARGRIIDLYKQIQSQMLEDNEPLNRLGLQPHISNALVQSGCKTVSDVMKILGSSPEIRQLIINIEANAYDEICESLKKYLMENK